MTVELSTVYAHLQSEFKSPIPQASEIEMGFLCRVESDRDGVPMQDDGVPKQDDGVHMQDGVPMQDDGVHMQDDGVPIQDDGVDMQGYVKWRRPPDRVWWP